MSMSAGTGTGLDSFAPASASASASDLAPANQTVCPEQIQVPGLIIGPDDTVVDIGCGEGRVCAYAGHQGAAVIGIDIEPILVDRASDAMRRVPARSWRGIVSDCNPIPLADGTASVIIATEVMEHVDDPARFLAELVRIGQPGARYVISVPDPASEQLLRIVAPGWYWKPPFHQHVFEHEALEHLLRDAGLEILARASSGFYYALWWTFYMALDVKLGEPTESFPLLNHWEAAWAGLRATPRGQQVIEELNTHLPRSQILLARKPGTPPRPRARGVQFGLPSFWTLRRWKPYLRDGSLHLGPFDLRWKIRRTRPRA